MGAFVVVVVEVDEADTVEARVDAEEADVETTGRAADEGSAFETNVSVQETEGTSSRVTYKEFPAH